MRNIPQQPTEQCSASYGLRFHHLLEKAADIYCDNLDYAKVIFDILRQNSHVDKVLSERKGHST